MTTIRRNALKTILITATAVSFDIAGIAAQALQTLYKTNPTAEALAKSARAILVFPKIVKAGLIFGGSHGEGVLT